MWMCTTQEKPSIERKVNYESDKTQYIASANATDGSSDCEVIQHDGERSLASNGADF